MLQLEPLERRAVIGERHLVFGATIEELKHAFRKSLFRDLAQVEDVVAVVQAAHSRFSLSPNDDSGIPCVNTERIYPRETFGVLRSVSAISTRAVGGKTPASSFWKDDRGGGGTGARARTHCVERHQRRRN